MRSVLSTIGLLALPLAGQIAPLDSQPRQFPPLLEDCGAVHFTIRCAQPANQKYFDLGIAHLHLHALLEAERYFRQVVKTEPDVGMAYWGMAMANLDRPQRAAELIEQGVLVRSKASQRGQRYLDSLAAFFEVTPELARANAAKKAKLDRYDRLPDRAWQVPVTRRAEALATALRKIVADHPDDVDAMLFYVDRLVRNRALGIPVHDTAAAVRLLDRAATRNPRHLSRYVRMRLVGATAAMVLALPAAHALPGSGIPETWHAEGRVKAAAGLHGPALQDYETARRGWHVRMGRHRMMPFRDPGYARLLRDYGASLLHHGEHHRLVRLCRWMVDLARHPHHNQAGNPQHLAGIGPIFLARSCGYHADAATLLEWLQAGRFDGLWHRFGRAAVAAELALAFGRLGRRADCERWCQRLRGIRADAWSKPQAARIDAWLAQASAFLAAQPGADGEVRRAIAAAPLDDFDRSLCWERVAEHDRALAAAGRYGETHRLHAAATAWQVRLLHAAARHDAAKALLAEWWMSRYGRPASFGAVESIARGYGDFIAGRDPQAKSWWRLPPAVPAGDAGQLPAWAGRNTAAPPPESSDWSPLRAPPFELDGKDGKRHRLADYRGKPVVVIQYLGFG